MRTMLKKMVLHSYSMFFICLIVSFFTFGNTLQNEFAVVDDLSGYIENTTIRDIPHSFSTLKLQESIYALNYHFFQYNPLPLRILAITNHAISGFMLYLLLKFIFKHKIAIIATMLFLIHPVVTESLNWVSAQFYIVMSIFIYSSLLALIYYRNTSRMRYIYLMIVIFALDILFIRHAWVFILPFVIIIFDYFLLKKKDGQLFYKTYISGIIPLILLFIIFNFSGQYTTRMLSRSESGKTLQNQQSLMPVIQGYPYTVYSLMRLYIFPKDLTIYYDGNKVTAGTYVLMYTTFILYSAGIIFFYKKDKRVAGLLILLLICILPVFSPKKITWFIAERYLYTGTGFFTTLIALFFTYYEKKLQIKHVAYIAAFILALTYFVRTITRNLEWKNPETLALSTIKTSPYSVRPYNDLAGYYVLNNDLDNAKKYYREALSVSPSMTAVRNLGHIYLETELDPTIQTVHQPVELIFNEAVSMIQHQEYFAAVFYLNEVLAQDPDHVEARRQFDEIYRLYRQSN